MGAALLAQWCAVAPQRFPDHRFFVIDPHNDPEVCTASERAAPGPGAAVFVQAPPSIELSRFDLVILAVKPQLLDAVAPDYVERLAPGGVFASIAAGASIARLKALNGGAPVVRIMPNLPAAIGQGASGLCADDRATEAQKSVVQALMEAAGSVVWVENEDQLDRLTAVAGSGPGYVFEIARAYVAAAIDLGFTPEAARSLVLDTMAGSLAMARQSSLPLAGLRDSVTSKGGTTAAGLDALNGDGALDTLFAAALSAAHARAVALR
jgi:pyrroline-5-carboxylate reductase